MSSPIRQSEIEAYLDEALPQEDMARIEKALRENPRLAKQAAMVHSRRSAGVHSLAEIWRIGRLSCATREQLGSHLLGALPEELADYLQFHIEVIGCRWCQANMADLESQQREEPAVVQVRRRKYFQSSVGHLRRPT